MPKVTRLGNRNVRSPAEDSLLSRIQSVQEMPRKGIILSVYGRAGTGKTTLACTFPKPLLIIGSEDGTGSVRDVEGIDFILVETSSEVDQLIGYVPTGHMRDVSRKDNFGGGYKTVVLDTVGGLQDLVLKEVLGLDSVPLQGSWGMANQETWGAVSSQVKEILADLISLSARGINIVIVAHEKNFTDSGSHSDVMLPYVNVAVQPATRDWLNGKCDYIGQMYIREQVRKERIEEGGQSMIIDTKTGRSEFCLRVKQHPIFMTRFRCPKGTKLPDAIVDPDYNKIKTLIEGGNTAPASTPSSIPGIIKKPTLPQK